MSVTAFRVENFMAFGAAGGSNQRWIELRPICLLFGRNSSGKSAIIRALRLLKQSLYDAPAGSPFAYSVEDGVDVGSFNDMLHRDTDPKPDDPKVVRFGFRCTVAPIILGRLLGEDNRENVPPWVELVLGFGWHKDRRQARLVELLILAPEGNELEDVVGRRVVIGADLLGELENGADNWWFWSDVLIEDEQDEIWLYANVRLAQGFLPIFEVPRDLESQIQTWRDQQRYQDFVLVRDLLNEMCRGIITFLQNFDHVRPLRPEPQRVFVLDSAQQKRWQQQGLQGYLKLLKNELTPLEKDKLSFWLRKLELGDSIELKAPTDLPDPIIATVLSLDEGGEGVHSVNLADVGYGVSQVLPILIQSILTDPGKLVIIEQPELHLHPHAQAELGDLFISLAQRGIHSFIETHSEHLLLRLRRRIAETTAQIAPEGYELRSNEVHAYFSDRINGCSTVERVTFGEMGGMSDLPRRLRDFFIDDLRETAELTRAQIEATI